MSRVLLLNATYEPLRVLSAQRAIQLLVRGMVEPVSEEIAARFHTTLADMIVAVARRIDESRVVLTGGCFQNGRLVEQTVRRLQAAGFRPYWHQRIPPNDGGIALGQAVAARSILQNQEPRTENRG